MCWQYVEQDNRNVFDVGFVRCSWLYWRVSSAVCEFNMEDEMCLIKRIPLKSAMECWISFVGNVRENRGKRRAASVLEN